jgi:type IV pilus assembly protein PilY1
MRPAVMGLNTKEGNAIGNLIMFGTGKLLTDSDRSDVSPQSFYAVVDEMKDSPSTISQSLLQKQTVTDEKTITGDANVRAGTYRKISESTLDLRVSPNDIKGWYLDLPTPSERLVTSPLIFEDKLVFGTGIPKSSELCLPGGKGWVMGLNPFTGSVTKNNSKNKPETYSFIDIDKGEKSKGKSTKEDKVSFLTGDEFISGFQKDGIPTELTFVASTNKIMTPKDTSGSNLDIGKVIAQRESNYTAVFSGNPGTTLINDKIIPNIKIYKPIPKPASTGSGTIYGGTVGSASLDKETLLSKFSGVKVETTTWREIK